MTNQDMIAEMLERLDEQQAAMVSTFNCVEALDTNGDCDLIDQMQTADQLMESLGALLVRMRQING